MKRTRRVVSNVLGGKCIYLIAWLEINVYFTISFANIRYNVYRETQTCIKPIHVQRHRSIYLWFENQLIFSRDAAQERTRVEAHETLSTLIDIFLSPVLHVISNLIIKLYTCLIKPK